MMARLRVSTAGPCSAAQDLLRVPFRLDKRSTLTAFQHLLPRSRGTPGALLPLVGAVSKHDDGPLAFGHDCVRAG